MRARIDRAGLGDIAGKLEAGVRLELEDGVRLFEAQVVDVERARA